VNEDFSTAPPLSLYGVSKKMSEDLALEYAAAFQIPVWINRCGVMAGAGQFGRADQGIVSFWIHSWHEGLPLKYLGFGGLGHQVRDCLHPDDLAALLVRQMAWGAKDGKPRLGNVSGGAESAFSLAELSAWCAERFGRKPHVRQDGSDRPFDIAWLVMDDSRLRAAWDWRPAISRERLFEGVASFAERHHGWMTLSSAN
jgi:CDP-paratose 2-epimerase